MYRYIAPLNCVHIIPCITIYCVRFILSHRPMYHNISRQPILLERLERIPYIAHVVRVFHDTQYQIILSTWSECLTICCVNPCCLYGQHVSPYIAHVARVSHDTRYQIISSTWSACLAIYCPYGQSVSQYAVSIRAVHMVGCIRICCIDSRGLHGPHYCPCGQGVSRYVASIHDVARVDPIYCPCGQGVSLYAVSVHSVYIASMSRHSAHVPQSVSVCIAHVLSGTRRDSPADMTG